MSYFDLAPISDAVTPASRPITEATVNGVSAAKPKQIVYIGTPKSADGCKIPCVLSAESIYDIMQHRNAL
ncbi:hypothetical protein BDN70DRAFT_927416 [Pholiota conissans]|uniref:Uncharacterized protein n=1 Tax=Pholiota conissans TaxID=109636 RepID=A0A9P5ZE47_9AGAR|nr:hypothetical protein BDN70DRAFT_927416 [Pholiota conissans]